MADTHVCKATDRPIWVLDPDADKTSAWLDHLDELKAWLKAHDLDANEVASAAVVRRADGSKQLHARRYLNTTCDKHSGYRYMDWTTNEAVSELVIVPLRMDPPHVCGAATSGHVDR
jgi:hypothetical protein